MAAVLALALALAGVVLLVTLWDRRSLRQMASAPSPAFPVVFPVKVKRSLLTRSERAFYQALCEVVPPGRLVLTAVRLSDLFSVQAQPEQMAARLRDKHVDFLVVSLPDFRPLVGIELDGASHGAAEQAYRDAVKDGLFQSGGLRLLRFGTRRLPTPEQLRHALDGLLS